MPWTPESIRQLLLTNDRAVVQACLALYERQLADEKAANQTRHRNGVGFNAADAHALSNIAKIGIRSGVSAALTLISPNTISDPIGMLRKRILKYCGQLADIANQQEASKMLETL